MGKDTWCEVMAKNKKGRKVEIFFWCCLPRPALLISRWAPINSWAFFFFGWLSGCCPSHDAQKFQVVVSKLLDAINFNVFRCDFVEVTQVCGWVKRFCFFLRAMITTSFSFIFMENKRKMRVEGHFFFWCVFLEFI